MTKLKDVSKASARSSFYLFTGDALSAVIMGLASLIVARMLGPENYGLYALALIVPSLLVTFADFGIGAALVRFTAHFRYQSKNRKVASLIKIGIVFKLVLSLLFSVTLLFISETIATKVLKAPDATLLIKLGSLYLIGETVLQTVNSIYLGLDNTERRAFLTIAQALTKAVFSLLLIFLGLGAIGATLGNGLSFLLVSGIGIGLLLLRVNYTLRQCSHSKNIDFYRGMKLMVTYGWPLYISAIIFTLIAAFRNVMVVLFASRTELGYYTVVLNFSVLVTFLSYPMAASLFPAFSKLTIDKDLEAVKDMFKLSVKYTSLVVTPVSLALVVLSRELVYTLYGAQFGLAANYLALYALNFLGVGLGTLVLRNFFNGQGETRATLIINLIYLTLSLPLIPILTILYGVPGIFVSMIASESLPIICGLCLARKKYGVSVDWVSSLKIVVVALLSALLVYVFFIFFSFTTQIYKLATGGLLYLVAFLVLAPFFGAIDKADIENLNEMLKELPIYPIARWILKLEERIVAKRLHSRYVEKLP